MFDSDTDKIKLNTGILTHMLRVDGKEKKTMKTTHDCGVAVSSIMLCIRWTEYKCK